MKKGMAVVRRAEVITGSVTIAEKEIGRDI